MTISGVMTDKVKSFKFLGSFARRDGDFVLDVRHLELRAVG